MSEHDYESSKDDDIKRPVIRMLGKASGRGGGGMNRKKLCRFCGEDATPIDFKNPQLIKMFITDRGKMVPRRITGNCAKHQRALALAVRRVARQLATGKMMTHG